MDRTGIAEKVPRRARQERSRHQNQAERSTAVDDSSVAKNAGKASSNEQIDSDYREKRRAARQESDESLDGDGSSTEDLKPGAVSVPPPTADIARTPEVLTETVEDGHPAPYAVEAHVVEEDVGMTNEEKQRLEAETRDRLYGELLGQATQAEVVDTEEDRKKRLYRLLTIGGLCFFLAIVIASIVTGVVVSRASSSDPEDDDPSEDITGTPTVRPSLRPSSVPSVLPTSTPLNNTFCDEALPITIAESVSDSFEMAILQEVVYCEAFSPYLDFVRGRWYVYRGEDIPVIASVDSSSGAADIHVYLNCGMACEDVFRYEGNDVQWIGIEGTEYLILVSEKASSSITSSDFILRLNTNDSRENAFGPISARLSTVLQGSTIGAPIPMEASSCGGATTPSGPGVWYSVRGDGGTIVASTCVGTSFDSQISIYDQSGGCVNGNDNFCSSQSSVAWATTNGENYFVLVHGVNDAGGNFLLQLATDVSAVAPADFCANAVALQINQETFVDLSVATEDSEISGCTSSGIPVPNAVPIGNFYRFTGTGRKMNIELVSTVMTDLCGTMVSILTGAGCSDLQCLEPECLDSCVIDTNAAQNYYLNIHYFEQIAPPEGTVRVILSEVEA